MKNFTGALGNILVWLFLYLAITKMTSNPQLFFNPHGIIIVFGGIVIAAFASFPAGQLYDSVKSVFKSLTYGSRVDTKIAEELVNLTTAYQKGLNVLETESTNIKHPFLKQSINLVLEGLNINTILEIMEKRISEKRSNIGNQMNVMLTLSKYAPSLGLAATVLGMVDMLSQLQDADMGKLGTGMAVALSATFYGIVIANLFLTPLSEMIASTGEIDAREAQMIHDGIQNMLQKNHPLVVGEIVNSYIEEGRRLDFYEKMQKDRKAA